MNAARAYTRTQNETASRERLMVLLFEAGLRHMRTGAKAFDQKKNAEGIKALSKASDIVQELLNTLHHATFPELWNASPRSTCSCWDASTRPCSLAPAAGPGSRARLRAHRARLRRSGGQDRTRRGPATVSQPAPDQSLVMALQATIAALEEGNIEAAAAAVVTMAAACEEAAQAGTVFSPAQLAEARRLQSRCEALAVETQAIVVAAVLQSSTQNKATHAYGSEK